MGARQSKRSVDITTTPKKGDAEVTPVNEDKIEKLGDADVVEVVTNGTAAHTDIEFADKDNNEAEIKPATEVTENGLTEISDGEKSPDKEEPAPAAGDQATKAAETVVENREKAAETFDAKKQKEKKKKKWSLRSISFSKKDKSKPSKDKDKNAEVEEVNEEKEDDNTTKPAESLKTDESQNSAVEETSNVQTEEFATKTQEIQEPSEKDKIEEVNVSENQTQETTNIASSKEEEKGGVVVASAESEEHSDAVKELTVVTSVVEEVKEVRNEEIPPPLPNSNPPSQVAVFAESLKDNNHLINENAASDRESHMECQSVEETPETKPAQLTESSEPFDSEHSVENVSESCRPIECIKESNLSMLDSFPKSSEPTVEIDNFVPTKVASEIESLVTLETSEADINSTTSLSQNQSELSDKDHENDIDESVNEEISSAGDSSPLIIEVLSKSNEDTALNASSVDSVALTGNNLGEQQSETSNLVETGLQGIACLEFEGIPLKIEDSDSTSSVPTMIEEKIPIVSSAGDVPTPLNSETPLQDSKSDIDLNTPISQESNLYDEQSLDLSTIPEVVESSEIKLEENENIPLAPASINVEIDSNGDEKDLTNESTTLPRKEAEPLCNAESLVDLSTESLPSLPEPTDSVLEPMSLPPLDSVPDPLIDDSIIPSEHFKPKETELEVTLTNGNTSNGTTADDDDDSALPPPLDGPLKQVIASETPVTACEISQSNDEIAVTVESVESQAQ